MSRNRFSEPKPSDHPDHAVEAPPQRPMSQRERDQIAAQHRSWISMIILQSAVGIVIGTLLALAVMHYDINRIGTMIAASKDGPAYAALFIFGFATLFGMVVSGTAIWLRAVSEEE